MQTSVITADTPSLHDLDGLAEIFNAYRVFISKPVIWLVPDNLLKTV